MKINIVRTLSSARPSKPQESISYASGWRIYSSESSLLVLMFWRIHSSSFAASSLLIPIPPSSMDKLWIFFILIHLLQFLLLCSAYTTPDKYFINCGSSANFSDYLRTFLGDENPKSFSLSAKHTSVINLKPAPDLFHELYQTARIFNRQSSYTLDISENGTYMVRFHFFAPDHPTAHFDVSASGSDLLQNFTVQNNSNSGVVKEFLLTIDVGPFVIEFKPQNRSFAFANAIEVFLCPVYFIPENASQVSPAGLVSKGDYPGLLSQVLQTVHRINVGGPIISASSDTLWRQWVPDDPYLSTPGTAQNSHWHGESPRYIDLPAFASTKYTAPDSIYKTAKMSIDYSSGSNTSSFSNITWGFNVSKNTKHLVRVHFCDITDASLGAVFFNLFFYSNFNQTVNPNDWLFNLNPVAVPFFFDYVVDSDDSGFMSVSISPRADALTHIAYLNGLEIMQIIGQRGSISGSGASKTSIRAVFVVAGLGLICCLVVTVLLVLVLKKGRNTQPVRTTSVWSAVPVHREGSSHAPLNLSLRISFAELESATNNIDRKLIIGKGGFGKVYSGKMMDGTKVAVKRSEQGSGQGLPEFHSEINVLSKIRHRHLVSLIGYCDQGPEMILVYEFMENGTLRDHLYCSKFPCLSWKQRLDICIGAARVLEYLHRGLSRGIIHRDVKSTNILLDENLRAKVADFGLFKLKSLDETHVSTVVKGTFGYLDPEYFRFNQLTEKSDVFSFGVVLLEVLCARPALDYSLDEVNLANWALLCKKNGMFEEIVDPLIRDQINSILLRKFGEVAERCLQEHGSDRPTMTDVVWDLECALQLQQPARHAEALEDSAAVFSYSFPSMSLSSGGDNIAIAKEDGSRLTATEAEDAR